MGGSLATHEVSDGTCQDGECIPPSENAVLTIGDNNSYDFGEVSVYTSKEITLSVRNLRYWRGDIQWIGFQPEETPSEEL